MSIEGKANENNSLRDLKGKINTVPPIDDTLTKQGHSADAKAVGDALAERVRKTVNSQKGFMGFLRKLFGRKSIIDERRTLPKPIDDYSVTYNHMKVEEMKKEREVPQKVKIKEEKER